MCLSTTAFLKKKVNDGISEEKVNIQTEADVGACITRSAYLIKGADPTQQHFHDFNAFIGLQFFPAVSDLSPAEKIAYLNQILRRAASENSFDLRHDESWLATKRQEIQLKKMQNDIAALSKSGATKTAGTTSFFRPYVHSNASHFACNSVPSLSMQANSQQQDLKFRSDMAPSLPGSEEKSQRSQRREGSQVSSHCFQPLDSLSSSNCAVSAATSVQFFNKQEQGAPPPAAASTSVASVSTATMVVRNAPRRRLPPRNSGSSATAQRANSRDCRLLFKVRKALRKLVVRGARTRHAVNSDEFDKQHLASIGIGAGRQPVPFSERKMLRSKMAAQRCASSHDRFECNLISFLAVLHLSAQERARLQLLLGPQLLSAICNQETLVNFDSAYISKASTSLAYIAFPFSHLFPISGYNSWQELRGGEAANAENLDEIEKIWLSHHNAEESDSFNPCVAAKRMGFENYNKLTRAPVRVDCLRKLTANFPDQEKIKFFINGFSEGFPLGIVLLPSSCVGASALNPEPACTEESTAITKDIAEEKQKGRLLVSDSFVNGCFESPIRGVQKKSVGIPIPGKWRRIHNLSHRFKSVGYSVNDLLSPELCSVQYAEFDEAVEIVRKIGPNAYQAKIDLESAYRQLPIRPEDWRFLGFQHNNMHYLDTRLPFGISSACRIFNDWADILLRIMISIHKSTNKWHMLDDFWFAEEGETAGQAALTSGLAVLRVLGVPCKKEKIDFGQSVTLLGVTIDAAKQQLRIPKARLQTILKKLEQVLGLKKMKRKDILSLAGILGNAAEILRPARMFVRKLIEVAYTVRCDDFWVRLTKDVREDLLWWSAFLKKWNGVQQFYNPLPLMHKGLTIATDASSSWGMAGVFANSWFAHKWTRGERAIVTSNIMIGEVHALTTAVTAFANMMAGYLIVFDCDNAATVDAINKGACKHKFTLTELRHIQETALSHNFHVVCRWVSSKFNSVADCLSRGQVGPKMDLGEQIDLEKMGYQVLQP